MRYRIGMKFAQETSPTAKLVTRYGADGLWIGNEHHTASVIVTPTTVTPWAARSVAVTSTSTSRRRLRRGTELSEPGAGQRAVAISAGEFGLGRTMYRRPAPALSRAGICVRGQHGCI